MGIRASRSSSGEDELDLASSSSQEFGGDDRDDEVAHSGLESESEGGGSDYEERGSEESSVDGDTDAAESSVSSDENESGDEEEEEESASSSCSDGSSGAEDDEDCPSSSESEDDDSTSEEEEDESEPEVVEKKKNKGNAPKNGGGKGGGSGAKKRRSLPSNPFAPSSASKSKRKSKVVRQSVAEQQPPPEPRRRSLEKWPDGATKHIACANSAEALKETGWSRDARHSHWSTICPLDCKQFYNAVARPAKSGSSATSPLKKRLRIVWVLSRETSAAPSSEDVYKSKDGEFLAALYGSLKKRSEARGASGSNLLIVANAQEHESDASFRSAMQSCAWLKALMSIPRLYISLCAGNGDRIWDRSDVAWTGNLIFQSSQDCETSLDFSIEGISMRWTPPRTAFRTSSFEFTFGCRRKHDQAGKMAPACKALNRCHAIRVYAAVPSTILLRFAHLFRPVTMLLESADAELYAPARFFCDKWASENAEADKCPAALLAYGVSDNGFGPILAMVPDTLGRISVHEACDFSKSWFSKMAKLCFSDAAPIDAESLARVNHALSSMPKHADAASIEAELNHVDSIQASAIAETLRKKKASRKVTLTSLLRSARLARDQFLHRQHRSWMKYSNENAEDTSRPYPTTEPWLDDYVTFLNAPRVTVWNEVARNSFMTSTKPGGDLNRSSRISSTESMSSKGTGARSAASKNAARSRYFPEEYPLKRAEFDARKKSMSAKASKKSEDNDAVRALRSKKRTRKGGRLDAVPGAKRSRAAAMAARVGPSSRRSYLSEKSRPKPKAIVGDPGKLLRYFDRESGGPHKQFGKKLPDAFPVEPANAARNSHPTRGRSWRDLCAHYSGMPFIEARKDRGAYSHGVAYNTGRKGGDTSGKENLISTLKPCDTLFRDVPPTPMFSPFTEHAYRNGRASKRPLLPRANQAPTKKPAIQIRRRRPVTKLTSRDPKRKRNLGYRDAGSSSKRDGDSVLPKIIIESVERCLREEVLPKAVQDDITLFGKVLKMSISFLNGILMHELNGVETAMNSIDEPAFKQRVKRMCENACKEVVPVQMLWM